MKDRISASAATRLIVRLRARRLFNRAAAAINRFGASKGSRRPRRLGGLLVVGAFLYIGFLSSNAAIEGVLDTFRSPVGATNGVPDLALIVFTGQLGLLLLGSLFATLGNRNLAGPEWDLEWLATLPIGIKALLWIRLLERSVSNPIALVSVWPLSSLLAALRLPLPVALPVGALVAFPLLAVVAALETIFDSGLRVRMRPSALRNLQAAASVLGAVCLSLAYVIGSSQGDLAREFAFHAPSWIVWTFPGAAARVLTDRGGNWQALIALLAQCGAIVLVARALVGHLLRHGVAGGGARESLRRPLGSASTSRDPVSRVANSALLSVSPLIRRELMLLLRDRAFLVQTALLPVLLVAFRFALAGSPQDGSPKSPLSAEAALSLGLGAAAYTLMFALLQTWRHEGRSLWLLYALPKPISEMLAQKAIFWSSFAALYPVTAAILIGFQFGVNARLLGLTVVALGGVALCATLATALSVLGAAPTSLEPRVRFKPAHVAVYGMIAITYGSAMLSSNLWNSAVLILLTSAAAFAFWQVARERLPFLLDPSAAPAPSLTLGHGLVAALAFFELQRLLGRSIPGLRELPLDVRTPLTLVITGALVFIAARLTFALSGIRDFPRTFGIGGARAAVVGSVAGISASTAGLVYFTAVAHFGWLARSTTTHPLLLDPWLAITRFLALPLFEELIFRGLLFGGLRRSFPFLPAAFLSALVFAAFHDSRSAPALLCMGMAAAWAYERTRLLIAPILCHVVWTAALAWFRS